MAGVGRLSLAVHISLDYGLCIKWLICIIVACEEKHCITMCCDVHICESIVHVWV